MKKALFLFFLLFSLAAQAQENVPFEKKYFLDSVKKFKLIKDTLDAGMVYYKLGDEWEHRAIHAFLVAEKFNPNNDNLNYLIGVSLLSHNSKVKTGALPYLEKALKLNPNVAPDIHYQIGRAYHLMMQWEKAKQEYALYLQTLNQSKDSAKFAEASKRIKECNYGEVIVKHPVHVKIENLGPKINSSFPEYSCFLSADQTQIVYTSKRPTSIGGKIDDDNGQYKENIYISTYKNGEWGPGTNMGPNINTSLNTATAGLSNDGLTLYIYRGAIDAGDLLQSQYLKGQGWIKADQMTDKIGKVINTPFQETTICFSPDGKTLYYVSEKPGGFGGKDIYKAVKDAKGSWQDPVNLGPNINTAYDEQGLYLTPDGKTLYFSSKGHNSMGGYDIFKSVSDTGYWSAPENLGYPINGPDDDVFFVLSADGKYGYYTSIRKDEGYGGYDLYKITFNPDEQLVKNDSLILLPAIKPTAPLPHYDHGLLLTGIITDTMTHNPLEATLELADNKKGSLVDSIHVNNTTGRYLIYIPSGSNYGISVEADGYLFYSANFDLVDTAKYAIVEKDIALQPLDVGSHTVLRNVFFDFDKATERPASIRELNRAVKLLMDYPCLKIELSGHTDGKGSPDYNKQLSEARARSVALYLEAHGISASRIIYKGYGATIPIATNLTDTGRQLNRRTELKVIATTDL